MAIEKLDWYWRRLRRMSLPEMGFRARNLAHASLQRAGLLTAARVPRPERHGDSECWVSLPPGLDAAAYLQAANAILAGRLDVFALHNVEVGHPPQWNRDPRSGRQAPLVFGKTLDYRDASLVGDIKYLWEPNRHLHLVTLAQAYSLSGQRRYLDGLAEQLDAWFDQCPYLMGPNWTSSLELAIRLINWSIVWNLVGGWDSPLFEAASPRGLRDRWLTSIYQHAHFVRHHFSRFSSANNHLLGEAAGVFVAAVTWPYWRPMGAWRDRARGVLITEMLAQNGPDGVNREQAVSYQQFVLDFALLAALAGRANRVEFPAAYWQRMEAMLEYLASIMDAGGNVPMIGDADDGYVVRLTPTGKDCPYRSLLATGAILFERGEFRTKSGGLDDKTRWLLGQEGVRHNAALEAPLRPLPVRTAFPDGGYYILGSDFETAREVRLVVDAGPLGYLSIAAHGHADALAFTLSVAGQEILVDPGTFAYHTEKTWRDYFRGTAAHNTVRIDGVDQSEAGGNFMWSRHAQAVCECWEPGSECDRFVGVHDGYERLRNPVRHRREIVYHKAQRRILITDTLECAGPHHVERYWHFPESCEAKCEGKTISVTNSGVHVRLRDESPAEIESLAYRAQETPPGGWVSRRFDVKTPSTTVVWSSDVVGNARFVTEIDCED